MGHPARGLREARALTSRVRSTPSVKTKKSQALGMTERERTIGQVPRLRRSDLFFDFPALPGWADVWRSAPPGLASTAICRVIGFMTSPKARSSARDDKGKGDGS